MNNSNYNSNYNLYLQLQGSMDRSHLRYPAMAVNTDWVDNNNWVDNNDQFSSQQFNSQQFNPQQYNSQQYNSQQYNSQQSNLQPLNSQWPNSQQFQQDLQLQGLPTTMSFLPQGNIPQGPNGSFQGMYIQPPQVSLCYTSDLTTISLTVQSRNHFTPDTIRVLRHQ
ncbi:hypothetical protein IWX90DRAFT_123691 [Phyllosticta citrichinensis]|uniref:Uncharacterized protein n=1 Tax=Phyllosticta citrichinensis TaxID=1130410 RepID=A0ABR1Y481_9PEZI